MIPKVILSLILFLKIFSYDFCKAQDTENKDICDSVTVYYKARLKGLNSEILILRLEHHLKEVKTIRDIKINPLQAQVTFNVNACINLTEDQLKKLILDAGVIPIEIKFSRDPLEVYPEEPVVQSF